jgi:transcriptional regulator with XRE-family HTH domain
MSEMTNEHIPALTLGWRLKMALGDLSAHEMADALEVSRGTVSRWMADKGAPPRAVYVRQWALITRTDPSWLLTGRATTPPNTPAGSQTTSAYAAIVPLRIVADPPMADAA